MQVSELEQFFSNTLSHSREHHTYESCIEIGTMRLDGLRQSLEVITLADPKLECKAGRDFVAETISRVICDCLCLARKLGLTPRELIIAHLDRERLHFSFNREHADKLEAINLALAQLV